MEPHRRKRKIGIILMLAQEGKHTEETNQMIRNTWLAWHHLAEELGEKLDSSKWVQ